MVCADKTHLIFNKNKTCYKLFEKQAVESGILRTNIILFEYEFAVDVFSHIEKLILTKKLKLNVSSNYLLNVIDKRIK